MCVCFVYSGSSYSREMTSSLKAIFAQTELSAIAVVYHTKEMLRFFMLMDFLSLNFLLNTSSLRSKQLHAVKHCLQKLWLAEMWKVGGESKEII